MGGCQKWWRHRGTNTYHGSGIFLQQLWQSSYGMCMCNCIHTVAGCGCKILMVGLAPNQLAGMMQSRSRTHGR